MTLPRPENFPNKGCRPAVLVLSNLVRRPGGNHLATSGAGFRTDIDNVIGFRNNIEVVLDEYYCVAVIDKAVQDLNKQLDVGHM
jgi:hypothetical protein